MFVFVFLSSFAFVKKFNIHYRVMASATTISKSLVRVGVGVFVVNASGTKFLVGKRKGSHGSGKALFVFN